LDGVLQNANSQFVAAAEIFSQPVTLETRTQDALQNFSLNLEPFCDNQSGRQPPCVYSSVDAAVVAHILVAVANTVNWREMFQTGVQMCKVDAD